jgi:hypothetical protein
MPHASNKAICHSTQETVTHLKDVFIQPYEIPIYLFPSSKQKPIEGKYINK